MTSSQANQPAHHIRADHDGDRRFLLHPSNDDKFVRTGKQIIEACELKIGIEVWFENLNFMLEHVRQWCQQWAKHVQACIAAPQGSRVALYFMPHGEQCDFDLYDGLAILNRDLIMQFNVGMIDVYQIPASELETFVESQYATVVYGDVPAAHQPVDA
jgi:hypothetical protein